MAKVKINYDEQTNWFDEPEGTDEELAEAFEITSSYLYKILDYADKEEPIPKEIVDFEKRIFSFAKNGPSAGHYRFDRRSKLMSADVLYMLSSTLPSKQIADKFGIHDSKVRAIRRGEVDEWYWEYLLIRRLKTIIKAAYKRTHISERYRTIYAISEMLGIDNYKILMYCSSIRVANKLRESIIPKYKYKELIRNKTLDIIYPIQQLDLV